MSEQRPVRQRPIKLVVNPGMILDAPGADLYIEGLQERLVFCVDYFLPLTLVGIYIDDVPLGTGSLLTPDLRTQLLQRAKTVIQRSVRSTPNERRKMTDAIFRLDPLYVVVLPNADRTNHLIPVGRIIESLRHASMVNEVNGRSAFRRRLVVGSVTLDPRTGTVRVPELTERMVEAVHQATLEPRPDAYERLRLGVSIHDEILYHDLSYTDERLRPADVIPRSATQPIARSASGPISSRAAVPVRSATGPVKPSDPKKPFWRFW